MRIDLLQQPYLDGALLPLCVMADEEAGVALAYRADSQGRPALDGRRELILDEHRGAVELRPITRGQ